MRKFTRKVMTAMVVLAASPVLAMAAPGAVALDSSIKLDKVTTVNGQTTHQFVAPEKVVPGNHLLFVTAYRNTSDKPVDHFVVTNPVPGAVALEGAGADNFEVSVDGGKTWGKLAQLTVAKPGVAPHAAQDSDVTTVRWVIPVIAPGASGTLQYHAVVR
ncbi:hypothetical protein [Novosphingobium sp.]|uniref:hypothetical protein n=1 Tax=Novosphingobium sp. TaxID=1874826 RepID=UPI003D0AE0C1